MIEVQEIEVLDAGVEWPAATEPSSVEIERMVEKLAKRGVDIPIFSPPDEWLDLSLSLSEQRRERRLNRLLRSRRCR